VDSDCILLTHPHPAGEALADWTHGEVAAVEQVVEARELPQHCTTLEWASAMAQLAQHSTVGAHMAGAHMVAAHVATLVRQDSSRAVQREGHSSTHLAVMGCADVRAGTWPPCPNISESHSGGSMSTRVPFFAVLAG
jgi:hypothetical protein